MEKQEKRIIITGVIVFIVGVIVESIGYATAATEKQLMQRATDFGSNEFLMLFGIIFILLGIGKIILRKTRKK